MNSEIDMNYFCKSNEYSTTRMLVESRTKERKEFTSIHSGGLRFEGFEKAGSAEKPLISVVIAVFNRSSVLEFAIRSVIYQTYENVELIIIDGGSTDGTLDIIKKYQHCIDYWVSEPDDGIYYALNKGIDASSGDWVYFLGSDDVMINCLHMLSTHLVDPFCAYYGDVYYPTPHKLFGGEFSTYRLMNRQIPHQATFYPKKLVAKHKYDTGYISAADYAYNIVCYNDPEFRYQYLPILVAIYEDTSGFSTLDLDSKFNKEHNELIKANFPKAAYRHYFIKTCFKNFERQFLRKIFQSAKKQLKAIKQRLIPVSNQR